MCNMTKKVNIMVKTIKELFFMSYCTNLCHICRNNEQPANISALCQSLIETRLHIEVHKFKVCQFGKCCNASQNTERWTVLPLSFLQAQTFQLLQPWKWLRSEFRGKVTAFTKFKWLQIFEMSKYTWFHLSQLLESCQWLENIQIPILLWSFLQKLFNLYFNTLFITCVKRTYNSLENSYSLQTK